MDSVFSFYDPRRTSARPIGGGSSCPVLLIGGWESAHGSGVPALPVESMQLTESGVAQPHRLLDHRIEHGLEIAGRGIDDFQDLGGRGLLF